MKVSLLRIHFKKSLKGLSSSTFLTDDEKRNIRRFFTDGWFARGEYTTTNKSPNNVERMIPLYTKFHMFSDQPKNVHAVHSGILWSLKYWKRQHGLGELKKKRAAKTIQKAWRSYSMRTKSLSASPPPGLSPASRVKWIVEKKLSKPAYRRIVGGHAFASNLEKYRMNVFAEKMRSHPRYMEFMGRGKKKSPKIPTTGLRWVRFPTGREEATNARTGTRYVYYPSGPERTLVFSRGSVFPATVRGRRS